MLSCKKKNKVTQRGYSTIQKGEWRSVGISRYLPLIFSACKRCQLGGKACRRRADNPAAACNYCRKHKKGCNPPGEPHRGTRRTGANSPQTRAAEDLGRPDDYVVVEALSNVEAKVDHNEARGAMVSKAISDLILGQTKILETMNGMQEELEAARLEVGAMGSALGSILDTGKKQPSDPSMGN